MPDSPIRKYAKGTVAKAAVPFVIEERQQMRGARGFTLVELVAVMLIAAILAVFASAGLNTRQFDTVTFAEEVRAQISYAQKIAVASRRPVTVRVIGNSIRLSRCTDFACSSNPDIETIRGGLSLTPKSGSGITIGTTAPAGSFVFDAAGNTPTTVDVTLQGDVTVVVRIEGGTGYVH